MPSASRRKYCAQVAAVVLLMSGCEAMGPSTQRPDAGPAAGPAASAPAASRGSPAASSTARPGAQGADAQFRDALQFMQAHDYAKAEPLLLDLTRSRPTLSGPYANLGIVYARTSRTPAAIQALQQAVTINPRNADAQNQLGVLLRQTGQLQAAEQAYKAALAASPDHAYAHLNLGVLYDVYLKQPAQALLHYEQYQRLAPDDSARVAVWIAQLKQGTQAKP